MIQIERTELTGPPRTPPTGHIHGRIVYTRYGMVHVFFPETERGRVTIPMVMSYARTTNDMFGIATTLYTVTEFVPRFLMGGGFADKAEQFAHDALTGECEEALVW